jgi:hypothetical protein
VLLGDAGGGFTGPTNLPTGGFPTSVATGTSTATATLTWRSPTSKATQADLDGWHATHNDHQRRTLRAFLRWAMRTGHLPRLTLPPLPVRRGAPLTQHRRLELLGRLLTGEDRPLRSRVAACLMLLFAQPATRIVRLTIDDLTRPDDGQVFIRFGEPPTPVPAGYFPDAEPASRCTPATSASSSAISAFPPWPAGPPRCASSSCRSQPPSSPRRWATTTTPRPGSPARPERPGAATPPATTVVVMGSDEQANRIERRRLGRLVGPCPVSPP